MGRLIDADALCRHLSDWQYGSMTDGKHDVEYGVIENVIEGIEKEPTIDAEPVRHGKWITEECLPGVAVCSICGHEIRGIGCQYTKYCDECGARMDKDVLTKDDRKDIDEEIERAWEYAETD